MFDVGVVFAFRKDEIHDADEIHGSQFEIPIAAWSLLPNRKSRVVDAAVFEEILLGLLHFDEELFARRAGAIQIKDRLAVEFGDTEEFAFRVSQILNLVMWRQQLIQEINQQILVRFFAEDFLEAKISKRVDVFFS